MACPASPELYRRERVRLSGRVEGWSCRGMGCWLNRENTAQRAGILACGPGHGLLAEIETFSLAPPPKGTPRLDTAGSFFTITNKEDHNVPIASNASRSHGPSGTVDPIAMWGSGRGGEATSCFYHSAQ